MKDGEALGQRPSTGIGPRRRRGLDPMTRKTPKGTSSSKRPEPQDDGTADPLFTVVPQTTKLTAPSCPFRVDAARHVTSVLSSAEERVREQLLIASEKGKKHAVYLLLHQGIDRGRCRGMRGFTPLHHAATRGHLDVLQLLVDAGWHVDVRNDLGETPMHLACYNGHTAIAEFLLDKGTSIDAVTADGESPIFYAARKGHHRIVRLLVRRECDLTLRNRFGDVPEDEADDEKTQLEFAVGREDSDRLYRRFTAQEVDGEGQSEAIGEQSLTQAQRERVLSFLDLRSLCRSSQVSYRWHRAADTPALWRQLGVSRWELLLQTTVGIGKVAPISGLRLNLVSLHTAGNASQPGSTRRPSSCGDPVGAGGLGGYVLGPRSIRRGTIMGGGSGECFGSRPHTARPPNC